MCCWIDRQRRTVRRPAEISRYVVSATRCLRHAFRRNACQLANRLSCHTVCRKFARRAVARSARTLLRASAQGEHARQREQALAYRQCFAHVDGQIGARRRRRA